MLRNIAVDTDTFVFSSSEKDRLSDFLKNTEEHTAIFSLDSPEQLALDSEFRTISGKSLITWLALKQVCGFLNNNFYKLITDISGKTKTSKSDHDSYCVSKRDASLIFNIVVRRKFLVSLNGKTVIKNVKSNTIESVVTDKYRRLANYTFFKKIEDALRSKSSGYSFNQASLHGRKLQVRYLFDQEIPVLNCEDFSRLYPVKVGLLFANSEHGNSSVKITLFLSFGGLGCCSVPFNSSWSIDHKGQNFFTRIDSLLNVVDNKRKEFDQASVERMLVALRDKNLGLSGIKEKDEKWLTALNKNLVDDHVGSQVANKVIRRTLFSADSDKIYSARESMPSKTALDVFVSMLVEGSKFLKNMAVRDNIEQSSFRLLSGKVRL
jgi:hypothetical protein